MEEKISVVIPNFNGYEILPKTLPKVIEAFPESEVIIVDDASTDQSTELIEKKFKKVKLIKQKKNMGFSRTVNKGVKAAKGRYVVLLNSDVSPKNLPLGKLVSYFGDSKTFAVGFMDISHEDGKTIKRGRGTAVFKKGFLNHFAAKPQKGKTFWVSGGSGIFDKGKFLELGGFDPIYAPFYWEDVDLSYRAIKQGYKCFFEPEAIVDHFHEEGAIQKSKSQPYIKRISYRNQFLFVWKNIEDPILLSQHLVWLPYHFAKALLNFDFDFLLGFFLGDSETFTVCFQPESNGEQDTRQPNI